MDKGHTLDLSQYQKELNIPTPTSFPGNSVLLIAAQNGRTDIIDDLLLKGADVNHGNNHRNVALHLAAQNGWTEIARKLLRHKKIIIDRADLHANTPLHLAAQNGQIGVRGKVLGNG